jgi:uncharacterized membrane protein
MSDTSANPDQKKVLRLYAAFGAALVLCIVPLFLAAMLSMGLFFGVLIAAYILRTDAGQGSFLENHMTYVIRTIWIGSFFALLTLTAGSIYLFKALDNAPLTLCINEFMTMGPHTTAAQMQALMPLWTSCFEGYVQVNWQTFLISFIVVAGPILIYFIARYAHGLRRAMGAYRVNKPLAWF